MATCNYSGPDLKSHMKSNIHKNYCCNDLDYELINLLLKIRKYRTIVCAEVRYLLLTNGLI